MTYERFAEILKEEGLSQEQIDRIWKTRPSDDLDELAVRGAAVLTNAQFNLRRS